MTDLSDEHDSEGLYAHGPRRQKVYGRDVDTLAEHDAQGAKAERVRELVPDVERPSLPRALARFSAMLAGQFAPVRRARRAAPKPRQSTKQSAEPWRPRFVPPGPAPYTPEQRDRARYEFGLARGRGTLAAPGVCECCDRTNVPLHGHHTDYAEPLRVTWLCAECHRLAHGFARPAHLLNGPLGPNGT